MPMHKGPARDGRPAAEMIDERIAGLDDWRGPVLAKLRAIILDAGVEITEDWKWNVPVWEHAGIVTTGEVYKAAVKLTFAKGAAVPDPKGLFNSSLEGNVRRAIDFKQGDEIDEAALKALVRAAAELNAAKSGGRKKAD